eukprot:3835063-Amphidinium_carterae.5
MIVVAFGRRKGTPAQVTNDDSGLSQGGWSVNDGYRSKGKHGTVSGGWWKRSKVGPIASNYTEVAQGSDKGMLNTVGVNESECGPEICVIRCAQPREEFQPSCVDNVGKTR